MKLSDESHDGIGCSLLAYRARFRQSRRERIPKLAKWDRPPDAGVPCTS
jgi:hypothetical protein